MFSSSSLFKTRISAHFLDAFVCEGELVTVEGWLTFYDEREKEWKPLDGRIKFYLDGKEIGEAEAKAGSFSFSFLSPYIGRHKLDMKFKAPGYEPSYRSLDFEVVKAEKKSNVLRMARLAFILIMLLVIVLFLSIFIAKQF
ncbi:MAG: hypothetical protein NZ872_03060 [Archaeoglobaceae archaeon]|nr:hypothetical protein [Archaeoglobaceae archaeon]MDW8128177.1 hypothetical protein [Archaeoglobaceae archaeon]